jgi:hypothetical protein
MSIVSRIRFVFFIAIIAIVFLTLFVLSIVAPKFVIWALDMLTTVWGQEKGKTDIYRKYLTD